MKCLFCGEEIYLPTPWQKYCSTECGRKARSEQKKAEKAKNPVQRVCEFCGKEITDTPPNRRFCSRACKEKASEQNPALTRRFKVRCVVCGKEFDTENSRKKYCSVACYEKGHQNLQRERLAREKAVALTDKALNKPTKTLSDWVREADSCGLDYGTYRALVEQGKSFEEIKRRSNPAKIHAPVRIHKAG